MDDRKVRVGVGVIIINSKGQVLLGKRKNSHGAGQWNFPGGKPDFGETIIKTAIRETKEETDLDIVNLEVIGVSNNLLLKDYNDQWITLYVKSTQFKGVLKTMEVEKCEGWQWFDLDNLPIPLFEPTRLGLEILKDNKIFSESK